MRAEGGAAAGATTPIRISEGRVGAVEVAAPLAGAAGEYGTTQNKKSRGRITGRESEETARSYLYQRTRALKSPGKIKS